MSYRPLAWKYNQLKYGGPTRGVDCTGWVGAELADAHTLGKWTTTGRAVRQNSDEPIPQGWPGNPAPPGVMPSPGLNQRQVDQALYAMSGGKVDLELLGGWTPRGPAGRAQDWLFAGRDLGVAVDRGILIDRMRNLGAIHPFRGPHQITLKNDDGVIWLHDPLTSVDLPADLPAVWAAGGALISSPGSVFVMAARDIIPSHYVVDIDPAPEAFWTYRVIAGVADRARDPSHGAVKPTTRPCTRVQTYRYQGGGTRTLVRLTDGAIADSAFPYVAPAASAIHYRGVLP